MTLKHKVSSNTSGEPSPLDYVSNQRCRQHPFEIPEDVKC